MAFESNRCPFSVLLTVVLIWSCGAPPPGDELVRQATSAPDPAGAETRPTAATEGTALSPAGPTDAPRGSAAPASGEATPNTPPLVRPSEEPASGETASSGTSPDAVRPEAPPGGTARCDQPSTLSPGDQSLNLEHDGATRTYLVHVPVDLDPTLPVPLVVDMHGLTSGAAQQAALSGWRAKADAEGFIVVHPQGLNASWNGGDLCCGASQRNDVDDEGFIRAMVAELQAAGCIDEKRIYATGLSNGGAMSHLLACNAADLFAATAPVSMGNGTRPCQPSRPISVVMTRGTRDALVGFDGGLFPSAQADFEQWAELNGCQGEPTAVDELCQTHDDCEGGVEVVLCALDAGHVLYENRHDFSVPDVAWATFERQVLP